VISVGALELAEWIYCGFAQVISCGDFISLIPTYFLYVFSLVFNSKNSKDLSFGIKFGSLFPA
jgi:hypothetical protein